MKEFVFCFLIGLFCSGIAGGEVLKVSKGAGNAVTFDAKAETAVSDVSFTGKGSWAEGEIKIEDGKASGTLKIPMGLWETGMGVRDGHLKKLFQVDKYPEAILELDPVAATGDVEWSGKLTLRGVTKPVKGKAKIGADRAVEADFKINIHDFGVTKDDLKFLFDFISKVDPNVQIHVAFKAG